MGSFLRVNIAGTWIPSLVCYWGLECIKICLHSVVLRCRSNLPIPLSYCTICWQIGAHVHKHKRIKIQVTTWVSVIMFVPQALIEKDWLAFGHKFSERCGHVAGDPKEVSPVFTQFIDCIWQLTQQFPATFQFNERFLLTLHDHVQSCQFGTFIGNCEKDRIDLRCVCTLQLCLSMLIV